MLEIFSEVLVLILMIRVYSLTWLETGRHPALLLIVVVRMSLWFVQKQKIQVLNTFHHLLGMTRLLWITHRCLQLILHHQLTRISL